MTRSPSGYDDWSRRGAGFRSDATHAVRQMPYSAYSGTPRSPRSYRHDRIGGHMAGEAARATAPRHRAKAEAAVLEPAVFEGAAMGEESTADALAALPELDWRVFHDVHWPGRRYANIDHVAVGPGGVFVIDSKAWAGDIDGGRGALRHNGHRRERHVLAAVDAAAAVGELLPGLDPATVKPVLCFDRDKPVFGWSREVMVCSTVNVATLLTSRPDRPGPCDAPPHRRDSRPVAPGGHRPDRADPTEAAGGAEGPTGPRRKATPEPDPHRGHDPGSRPPCLPRPRGGAAEARIGRRGPGPRPERSESRPR